MNWTPAFASGLLLNRNEDGGGKRPSPPFEQQKVSIRRRPGFAIHIFHNENKRKFSLLFFGDQSWKFQAVEIRVVTIQSLELDVVLFACFRFNSLDHVFIVDISSYSVAAGRRKSN